MKQKIALLGVIIAAGLGVGLTSSTIFSTPLLLAQAQDAETSNNFGMMGHIELTATDPDGNIKHYIQTDNTIVNIGENCLGELLFDVDMTGAGDACDGSTGITFGGHGSSTNGFTFLAIGNNTGSTAELETNTDLDTQVGSRVEEIGPSVTPSTGTSSSAEVILSEVFTPGANTISEAGLFDASTGGNMLARQVFTGIPLGASDQLTVQWTITLGG
ncbi:MAG: hypothetical protein ACE5RJ_01865 [Nitrosopumilaceae archaeon]